MSVGRLRVRLRLCGASVRRSVGRKGGGRGPACRATAYWWRGCPPVMVMGGARCGGAEGRGGHAPKYI